VQCLLYTVKWEGHICVLTVLWLCETRLLWFISMSEEGSVDLGCLWLFVVNSMSGEDSEMRLCDAKSLSMTTLRMTAEAKV